MAHREDERLARHRNPTDTRDEVRYLWCDRTRYHVHRTPLGGDLSHSSEETRHDTERSPMFWRNPNALRVNDAHQGPRGDDLSVLLHDEDAGVIGVEMGPQSLGFRSYQTVPFLGRKDSGRHAAAWISESTTHASYCIAGTPAEAYVSE